MKNKTILGETARVTGKNYSLVDDLIKEVINNHEIIVIDGKEKYDLKKLLLKNKIIVKN